MKTLKLCLIGTFLFLVQIAAAADEPLALGLGMWSWSQSNFSTPEAKAKILAFCAAEKISHIDQHLSLQKKGDGYLVKNGEALKELLKSANDQKISINALRGERTMFFAANHEKTLRQLQAIIRFNEELPKGSRLAGIKFDVEPYLTPEWRAGGDSQKRVITDYLEFLVKAKALIDRETDDFDFSVDIPFWWDKPEFSIELNGNNKLLIHHIIDLTDWIGIMSYRRESEEVVRLTTEEFSYAKSLNKTRAIAPGLNTAAQSGDEHWTSFEGVSPTVFRKTLTELREKFATDDAARLIMIHDYKGMVSYLQRVGAE